MVNFNSVPQIIPRLIEQYHLEKTFIYTYILYIQIQIQRKERIHK